MKCKFSKVVVMFFISTICVAQVVNVPDANFKAYLLAEKSINVNSDGEIQVSEASAFVGHINVSNLGISDMTGIEAFNSLTVLNCFGNNLTTIDLSGNANLQSLYCNNNQINTLDLSANPNLFQLQCNNNQLSSLNFSANTQLKYVYCQMNNISNLNLTGLGDLSILFCGGNGLSVLNISDNDSLVELDISNNSIASLSFVECAKLQVLNLKGNNFSVLNTMVNSNLVRLDCSDNDLTELSISNGKNHKLKWFDSKGNGSLTCIEIDNQTWANTNLSYGKDTFVNFSTNCP